MKLQARFLTLLLFVFVAVAGSLIIQRSFDLQRSQQVLKSELSQRKSLFKAYLSSEGRTFQTFSEDYSFWDDMVNFVKTDNLQFAHVNLDSGLSTFGSDADWVYRPDGTLLYTSKADPSVAVDNLPLTSAFFKKLTADKFEHFYLQMPAGTLEVRAATIVPGNDPNHADPPAGFWVVGRFLSNDFIKNINSLSQSNVHFVPATSAAKDVISSNSVTFTTPLKDWRGQTVELLSSTSRISVISDLNTLYRRELILLAVMSVIMLGLVWLAIWRLVLRPVHLIAGSIQQQQPELLAQLSKTRSQFGDLAKTVQQFFQQKLVIQEGQFKAAELERLNKDKTAFLALAAHELKGPISIVKLLSEDLPKTLHGSENTDGLIKKLAIITHQITKMTVLINDLRLASEGKENSTFNKTIFDFDSFLQKEITEAGFITNQKLVFEGGTGKQVDADPDRLSQVVSNLIRNASKYSPDADKIIIRSSVSQQGVVVEVEDFGVGISAEDQAHIFERFYRAPSVTESFQGLGLGLSICKDIIERLGGKIWAESTMGHGTHFYFSLPIANP